MHTCMCIPKDSSLIYLPGARQPDWQADAHACTQKSLYIHIYIYTYTYTYTYIHIYTFLYRYIYIYIYTYTHICIYMYTHMYVYMYMHICNIYVYMYAHTSRCGHLYLSKYVNTPIRPVTTCLPACISILRSIFILFVCSSIRMS